VDEPSHGLDQQRPQRSLLTPPGGTELEEELLQTRDELIAAEARLGEALGQIRVLENELGRYQEAAGRLDRFARCPVWRYQRLYERLRGRMGRVRARLLRMGR